MLFRRDIGAMYFHVINDLKKVFEVPDCGHILDVTIPPTNELNFLTWVMALATIRRLYFMALRSFTLT
jgi:hypothetical protein